ncbi:MAG: class I SAM-dependent methyltransferase [Gammaproteobacteria bacterium]|jgi:SAM-dependent methyltransferase
MLAREAFSRPRLERQPEPTAEMEDPENVLAFHAQGAGPLVPVYHFNALATSRLLRPGGTVFDLGSGSGQYLAYLARLRPDARVIGLELSSSMASIGQRFLADSGLNDRVELRTGDMTSFTRHAPENIDVISSVFALHHLPTLKHLSLCFKEIALARQQHQCAIWLFDHVRPRHPRTPEVFPEIFTPKAPAEFRTDSCNSLRASFSFEQMSNALDSSTIGAMEHHCARFMPLYQAHWIASQKSRNAVDEGQPHTAAIEITQQAKSQFNSLRMLFPGVQLDRVI